MTATFSNADWAMPTLDLSWTITAVIAVAAFLSPIIVAFMNNRHAHIIRQLDIAHAETLKKMELESAFIEKQFTIYYSDKKMVFSNFLQAAGNFSMYKQSSSSYAELQSSLSQAMLFCTTETQHFLLSFQKYVDENVYGNNYTISDRLKYSQQLMEISQILNSELTSTKPMMNRD